MLKVLKIFFLGNFSRTFFDIFFRTNRKHANSHLVLNMFYSDNSKTWYCCDVGSSQSLSEIINASTKGCLVSVSIVTDVWMSAQWYEQQLLKRKRRQSKPLCALRLKTKAHLHEDPPAPLL